MTPEQTSWLMMTAAQAYNAGHIYPRMAACEAGLESAYGKSQLARLANNLFGLKVFGHPTDGTLAMRTKEFLDGQWVEETDEWKEYKNAAACFQDRMATLLRLRLKYPHYDAALKAPTPEQYVMEVSRTWSTDPDRASKVIAIYHQVFQPAETNATQVQQATTGDA